MKLNEQNKFLVIYISNIHYLLYVVDHCSLTLEFFISCRNSLRAQSACCLISKPESLNMANKPEFLHAYIRCQHTLKKKYTYLN